MPRARAALLVSSGFLLAVIAGVVAVIALATRGAPEPRPRDAVRAAGPPGAGAEHDGAGAGADADAQSERGAAPGLTMANVALVAAPGLAIDVVRMRGRLQAKGGAGPIALDRPGDYDVLVDAAEVRLPARALQRLAWSVDERVPGLAAAKVTLATLELAPGAPGTITQTGQLALGALRFPFSLTGTLAPTPGGDLRVEVTALRVGALEATRLLEVAGVDMRALLDRGGAAPKGVRPAEGMALVVSLSALGAEPRMRGAVREVRIEEGAIVVRIGDGPLPERSETNHLVLDGGDVLFGKMAMRGAVAELVDADPQDPLRLDMKAFEQQLFASVCRATAEGVRIHVVDADDVPAPQGG